jgi:hypothetical protein
MTSMKLYHYTSQHHLPYILRDGHLKVTESNIGSPLPTMEPSGMRVGPDVVWFSTHGAPDANDLGLVSTSVDKTKVRFTVNVKDAEPWCSFADRHEINPEWRDIIEEGRAPKSWYVVERNVLRSEWLYVQVKIGNRWSLAVS